MKVYTYGPRDFGWDKLPPGRLRLDRLDIEDLLDGKTPEAAIAAERERTGVEHVRNPNDADVFVCPAGLGALAERGWHPNRLPHIADRGRRHVFFDIRDDWKVYPEHHCREAIFLRCNLTDEMGKVNPNSRIYNWPVQVKEWDEIAHVDPNAIEYDVSFHGWRSSDVCVRTLEAVKKAFPKNRIDIVEHPGFWGYMPDGDEKRKQYRAHRLSMAKSLLVLSPASLTAEMGEKCGWGATIRYRFFEAMIGARVPVHVGSAHPWPSPDLVDWSSCSLRYEEKDAERVGVWLREFVDRTPRADILAMGRRGREAYLRHLDPDNWPDLWRHIVKGVLGITA